MFKSTTSWGWLGAALIVMFAAMPAQAQRTVTLTLNMATSADTTRSDSFIEVRGAVNGVSPVTINDQGDIIDWSDASTLEPVNIGGDYWQLQFELPDTTNLTFKFYSQQSQDVLGEGWEADPNPVIPPGTVDTTLAVHFFESQREYKGVSGDRGDYDWRPYEVKPDSVAVLYRVYLNTPEGQVDGYDRTNPNHHATVTGDSIFAGAPFNWGSSVDGNGVALERESSDDQLPGFDLFSGVVYYPMSATGSTQQYKFVLEDENGIVGWEEGDLVGNRSFVVPAQDTTLRWVYFGNQAPDPTEPVTQNVIFTVDLDAYDEMGIFRKARGDTLEVRGTFNNFGCNDPTICQMLEIPGENTFEGFYSLTLRPETQVAYKYFLNFNDPEFVTEFGFEPPPGWEEGHRTGVDRTFIFEGNPNNDQDLGLSFFNDITSLNVIPSGTAVTVNYSVDMEPAVNNAARPFDASADDSVWISVEDPIWALTQRVSNPSIPFADPTAERPEMKEVLEDGDGDGVYTGSVTIEGPTYSNLTFRYRYGQGTDTFTEPGTGLGATPGRNRTNYIKPNPDGSWPSSYDVGTQTFSLDGPLPFEENPAFSVGVEPVDGELPREITLRQNFPNPFNPTTTFEYAISASQKVELHVFDVIGRRVATLVDGVQPANTYRVTFDARDLASGTYFYRLETDDKVITRSMVLLK